MGLPLKVDDGRLEGSVIRDLTSATRLYYRTRDFATLSMPPWCPTDPDKGTLRLVSHRIVTTKAVSQVIELQILIFMSFMSGPVILCCGEKIRSDIHPATHFEDTTHPSAARRRFATPSQGRFLSGEASPTTAVQQSDASITLRRADHRAEERMEGGG